MFNSAASPAIAAFTQEQVVRLTGVSQRQLRYWAKDGFFVPGLPTENGSGEVFPFYSFRDLVCLKVISSIRNEGKISLQELKATKDRLRHLGDDMWAKTTLYILGKRIVFENHATGSKEEASTGQGVLPIALKVVTGKMEEAVLAMRQRRTGTIGHVEKQRGVMQNQPVIAGTRIPVRSIQAFAKAGYTVPEIIRQYPGLEPNDIEAARAYKDVA